MKQLLMMISTGLFVCTLTIAQPTINANGVVNAASYIPPGLVNSGIAQGSMFVIFGKDIAPAGLQQASVPLPTKLAFTSVRIDSGNQSWDAPLVYTSPAQVAAILPSKVPVGNATVRVTTRPGTNPNSASDQTSSPVQFQVVGSAAGIFTRNQGGFGAGLAQNYKAANDQPLNDLMHPAQPGQVVTLWATGLGPIEGGDSGRPPVGNVGDHVEVLVGGTSAQVLYAGRSSEFPGIDQINFVTPSGVEGCNVPVTVTAGGIAGNFATIAITASGTTCSDHTGVATDLEAIRTTGSVRTADVRLGLLRATAGDVHVNVDDVIANVFHRNVNDFLAGVPIVDMSSALGTCQVYDMAYRGEGDVIPEDVVNRDGLEAGPVLNVTGPLGTKQITREGKGEYEVQLGGGMPGLTDQMLPDYLVPGDYTLDNGSGGDDVKAFTAKLTIPQPIQWTNQSSFTNVKRSVDQTVTWTGGDSTKEFVFISGLGANQSANISVSFVCTEKVAKGQFTIPASILSRLPATTPWTGVGVPLGNLTVGTMPTAQAGRFTASGLDFGYFGYMLQVYQTATYQ
jgi:uncharacterized protein (TIGR03437 family)